MTGHALIAAALLISQATTPPPRPCLSTQEAGAMAAVAVPELVEAFAQRCSQHLPETAFLRSGTSALVERWRAESGPHRDTAFAALGRMAPPGAQGTPPDVALRAMIGGLAGGMAAKLDPATCNHLSGFVESLAPLPAANVAQLVGSVMGFGKAMSGEKEGEGPPICRPS